MTSINTINPAGVSAVTSAAPAPQTDAASAASPKNDLSTPAKDPRRPGLASETANALLVEQNKVVAEPEPRNSYEVYMPTREGFTSHAFAVGVQDPDAVSSSAGLDDAGVMADARARLNDKYARMEASGKAYGSFPREGMDMNSLIGDLDRRSLNSIVSDTSGLFSEDERKTATYALEVQDSFRGGGYTGPSRLYGQWVASGASGMSRADANDAMKAFDQMAAKDTSIPSQLGRASMRVLLGEEASTQLFGGVQTTADDKMMTLLVDALTKAREKDSDVLDTLGSIKDVDDLKKADWFADYRDQLESVLSGATKHNDEAVDG